MTAAFFLLDESFGDRCCVIAAASSRESKRAREANRIMIGDARVDPYPPRTQFALSVRVNT
jgi:hypothetical protein